MKQLLVFTSANQRPCVIDTGNLAIIDSLTNVVADVDQQRSIHLFAFEDLRLGL